MVVIGSISVHASLEGPRLLSKSSYALARVRVEPVSENRLARRRHCRDGRPRSLDFDRMAGAGGPVKHSVQFDRIGFDRAYSWCVRESARRAWVGPNQHSTLSGSYPNTRTTEGSRRERTPKGHGCLRTLSPPVLLCAAFGWGWELAGWLVGSASSFACVWRGG